jgi:hypothetical protein
MSDEALALRQQHTGLEAPFVNSTVEIDHEVALESSIVRGGYKRVDPWT